MNFSKEDLVADFSEFLKTTLEKSPEMNMEEFIIKYFDELVSKIQLHTKEKIFNIQGEVEKLTEQVNDLYLNSSSPNPF